MSDCQKILTGSTIGRDQFKSVDAIATRKMTFIVAGVTEKPWDVNHVPWGFRQIIPEFFAPSRPMYHSAPRRIADLSTLSAQYPGCIAAILPVANTNGVLSYDTGRYPALAAKGLEINRFCVGGSGIPGAGGTGGIDFAGDNSKIRFVLYGPYSSFDNDTREDQADGMTVSVAEDSDSDATISGTDDDDGPAPQRQKTGGRTIGDGNSGGMGLMSASGVRSLDGGWEMTYASTTYMDEVNFAKMETFWTNIGNKATDQISQGINETDSLTLAQGRMSLGLQSTGPISWNWVYDFAAQMLQATSDNFAALFTGEAYSNYYVIASVAVVLSIV